MNENLSQKREAVVKQHFESEVAQDFERTLSTFEHPHYEIMANKQVYDGAEEVMQYYLATRTAFPDQRHENVRLPFAEDVVVAEFDLLGTNSSEFYGLEPTNRSFRVPVVSLFFFVDDKIINERIYFDSISLLSQIGQKKALEQ